MKYKILFPVETTTRELSYKLLLSARFAALGHECYVGSKSEISRLFEAVSPFVYFDKGYHKGVSEQIYANVKKHGGLIVNLDEEGGVDFADNSTILNRYADEVFALCDLVFLWGRKQYDFLKSNKAEFRDDKVIVTGHPRFELLKESYHYLYEKEAERLRRTYGDYILVCTNMGFGNNIRGDDFVRTNYGSRIRLIEEMIAFDKLKVASYVSMVRRLSSLSACNIVLRPHPEETMDAYRKPLAGIKNVSVIYENSVIPWIAGSKVMIHPDCTTGIEATMYGKTAISYLPQASGESSTVTVLPVKLSYCFQREDELIAFLLNDGHHVDTHESITSQLLNDFFSFQNDSADMIVQTVIELLDGQTARHPAGSPANGFPGNNKWIALLKGIYHAVSGSKAGLLTDHKLKGLNMDAINALLAGFKSVMPGVVRGVKVVKMNDGLFKLWCQE